jgi:hypothetical protein
MLFIYLFIYLVQILVSAPKRIIKSLKSGSFRKIKILVAYFDLKLYYIDV